MTIPGFVSDVLQTMKQVSQNRARKLELLKLQLTTSQPRHSTVLDPLTDFVLFEQFAMSQPEFWGIIQQRSHSYLHCRQQPRPFPLLLCFHPCRYPENLAWTPFIGLRGAKFT